jgi:nucleoside phosphorylase
MPIIMAIAALSSELAGIRRHLRRTGSLTKSAPAADSGDYIRLEEGRVDGWDSLLLVQSGMGRTRAERVLSYVLQQYRPAAVLSLGFCGALDASLRVGDLVLCSPISALGALPTTPRRPVPLEGEVTCDPSLVEEALRVATAPVTGSCLTLPGVASDPAFKEWLSSTYGHAVVDMESFWLGRLAEEAGVPFLAVRSVSDSRGEFLPPLDDLVDDLGHLRLPAMSRYLLGHPQGIVELARLARQAQHAEKSLTGFTLQFLKLLQ